MGQILQILYNISDWCSHVFLCYVNSAFHLYSEQRRSMGAFLCVQSCPGINIFSVSSLQRVNSHPSPLLPHRDKTFRFLFFSAENYKKKSITPPQSAFTLRIGLRWIAWDFSVGWQTDRTIQRTCGTREDHFIPLWTWPMKRNILSSRLLSVQGYRRAVFVWLSHRSEASSITLSCAKGSSRAFCWQSINQSFSVYLDVLSLVWNLWNWRKTHPILYLFLCVDKSRTLNCWLT